MNLHISAAEIQTLLFHRIQKAGLLKKLVADRVRAPASTSELGWKLCSLAGSGWRHDCFSEPIIHWPVAVCMPCDLSPLFAWSPVGQENREFYFTAKTEFPSCAYYLTDIKVYHRPNLAEAQELLKQGWHALNLLECAQVLAQSCADYDRPSIERGFGSLTTLDTGIPVKDRADPLQLHVFFCGIHGVLARHPHGETTSTLLYGSDHNHHVAVCREIIDPNKIRQLPLGELTPTAKHP